MLRSRLALRCLDSWPLKACLDILSYCTCDPEVSEELKSDLQNKTRELQVYQKVNIFRQVALATFPLVNVETVFLVTQSAVSFMGHKTIDSCILIHRVSDNVEQHLFYWKQTSSDSRILTFKPFIAQLVS